MYVIAPSAVYYSLHEYMYCGTSLCGEKKIILSPRLFVSHLFFQYKMANMLLLTVMSPQRGGWGETYWFCNFLSVHPLVTKLVQATSSKALIWFSRSITGIIKFRLIFFIYLHGVQHGTLVYWGTHVLAVMSCDKI